MWRIWCMLIVLVCVPVIGQAATYYVATTGTAPDCATAENIATPLQTIAAGIACLVAENGDILDIRAGTYAEVIASVPSGTAWANAATIRGHVGETVVLNPSGVEQVVALPSESYIILSNLTLDAINVSHGSCIGDGGPGGTCFGYVMSAGASGGHHVRVTDSILKNGYANNIATVPAATPPSLGSYEFLNSAIFGSRYSYGMYLEVPGTLVSGNTIYDNAGYAIQIYNGTAADADNIIVRNNRMYNNGTARTQSALLVSSGENSEVYNNLIYNNFGGIDVRGDGHKIWNNTIYNSSDRSGIEIFNADSITVQNNIVYLNAGGIDNINGTNITSDHNLETDPSFVDAGNNNYQLQSGSAAHNTGATIATVTTDFAGVARPQGAAYDIGAYEFVDALPVVSIAATDATAGEPNNNGLFTLSCDIACNLTVNCTMSGSATPGSDYTAISCPRALVNSDGIAVTVQNDGTPETTKNVIFTVDAGTGYTIGTSPAQITLTDDDVLVLGGGTFSATGSLQ